MSSGLAGGTQWQEVIPATGERSAERRIGEIFTGRHIPIEKYRHQISTILILRDKEECLSYLQVEEMTSSGTLALGAISTFV